MRELCGGQKIMETQMSEPDIIGEQKIYPTKLKAHQVVQKVEMDNFIW